MTKTTKILLVVVVLIIVIFVWHQRRMSVALPPPPRPVVEQPATSTPIGDPTFTWNYATYQEDYVTKNKVSITATYTDGNKITKDVEVIEGECNEYPSPDKDVYAKSKMIICYYAGFGRYFKVVKDDKGYSVMRKEFEEVGPDYNPPVQGFKELVRF